MALKKFDGYYLSQNYGNYIYKKEYIEKMLSDWDSFITVPCKNITDMPFPSSRNLDPNFLRTIYEREKLCNTVKQLQICIDAIECGVALQKEKPKQLWKAIFEGGMLTYKAAAKFGYSDWYVSSMLLPNIYRDIEKMFEMLNQGTNDFYPTDIQSNEVDKTRA